ncbi:hypothetical protein BC008_26095 [Mastigocoleus testarum BC008]|uniref:Addiction module toxin RelE n=1 Tax=Mastigocoleus testarum BC008 TaxID=371196 RepID=A0A0V7ZNU4_9CYAN|nr:hypothetical protein BC008_25570 [Mastigocoleus testarum BC008]KST66721.1 hypothetical protein BC008_26095 [Mastigocoleus testarum BC008]
MAWVRLAISLVIYLIISLILAEWKNLIEVQAIYPKASAFGNFTVFNIKENNYRLIVDIIYKTQRIYIKYVLTHAEYDKDK